MNESLLHVTECFSEKSSTVCHNVALEAINSKLKIAIEQRKALFDTGLLIDTQKWDDMIMKLQDELFNQLGNISN